jgi:hypothetical protein
MRAQRGQDERACRAREAAVSESRSHRANRYGTLAERQLAEEYRLDLDRCSWHDAKRDGRPWELKAAMLEHSNGQPGTFKLYRKYHEKLAEAGGMYAFAAYKPWGRGIRIVRSKAVSVGELPLLRWHGGGDHRDTEQAKVPIDDVL